MPVTFGTQVESYAPDWYLDVQCSVVVPFQNFSFPEAKRLAILGLLRSIGVEVSYLF
jgi:hypothetical protein